MEINLINNDFLSDVFDSTNSETTDTTETFGTDRLELMGLKIELQKCLRKDDYAKAADVLSQMISLSEKIDHYDVQPYHIRRAYCLILSGQLEEGIADLDWARFHQNQWEKMPMESIKGLAYRFHGEEEKANSEFQLGANRGDLLCQLLLNQKENTNPVAPAILALDPMPRIKQLVIERHYQQAIDEINQHINGLPFWHSDRIELIKIRATCHALCGNIVAAAEECSSFEYDKDCQLLLAQICFNANHKERALKILDQSKDFFWSEATKAQYYLLKGCFQMSK